MVALSFETSSTSHLIGRGKGVKMEAKKKKKKKSWYPSGEGPGDPGVERKGGMG